MSRKKHAAHEEHENHERWLVTYADMITLMMAFFVMLYGMSILDLKKFSEFKAGTATQLGRAPVLTGGKGILLGGEGIEAAAAPAIGAGAREGATDAPEVSGDVNRANAAELVSEVRRRLDSAGLANDAELDIDPRGVVIYVKDRVLFRSGSAFMEEAGRKVLDQLALALGHVDNQIVVEGHTDDRPTRNSNGFASNWELSTARATQVLRWLVEVRHLPGPRFSAAGYADTRPRALNDSAAHRALNRRVEIVVVVPPQEVPDGQVEG